MIQRFQKDRTVLDVIDFVEKNSTLDNERWAKIKGEVERKSSTLRRFIEAKPVKELLGLSTSVVDGVTVPAFEVDPVVALQLFSVVFEKIEDRSATTRSYNSNKDFQEFVDGLPDELRLAKRQTSLAFREAEVKDGQTTPRQAKAAEATKASKKSKVSKPRPTLAPASHQFAKPKSSKAQRMLYEASRIKLNETPLAASYLLRAFIEQSVDTYIDEQQISDRNPKNQSERLSLAGRAELVLEHLKSSKKGKADDFKGVRRLLTNTKDSASIQALNDYHHNQFQLRPSMHCATPGTPARHCSLASTVKRDGLS